MFFRIKPPQLIPTPSSEQESFINDLLDLWQSLAQPPRKYDDMVFASYHPDHKLAQIVKGKSNLPPIEKPATPLKKRPHPKAMPVVLDMSQKTNKKHSFATLFFKLDRCGLSLTQIQNIKGETDNDISVHFNEKTGVVMIVSHRGTAHERMHKMLKQAGPFQDRSILGGSRHHRKDEENLPPQPYSTVAPSIYLMKDFKMSADRQHRQRKKHFDIKVIS